MYTHRQDMEGTNINWHVVWIDENCYSETYVIERCDWSKMNIWPFWREPQAPGHLSVWLGLTWSAGIQRYPKIWPSKMQSGIVYHKSDHKSCVIPKADRNNIGSGNFTLFRCNLEHPKVPEEIILLPEDHWRRLHCGFPVFKSGQLSSVR